MDNLVLIIGGLVFLMIGLLIIKFHSYFIENYLKSDETERLDYKFVVIGIGVIVLVGGSFAFIAVI